VLGRGGASVAVLLLGILIGGADTNSSGLNATHFDSLLGLLALGVRGLLGRDVLLLFLFVVVDEVLVIFSGHG